MHHYECTIMLLDPIIYFNLMKNIIFPMFYEHKKCIINYFSSISKRVKFRLLQCT